MSYGPNFFSKWLVISQQICWSIVLSPICFKFYICYILNSCVREYSCKFATSVVISYHFWVALLGCSDIIEFLRRLHLACWPGCSHLKACLCQRIRFQAHSHGHWQEASVPQYTGLFRRPVTCQLASPRMIWETKTEAAVFFIASPQKQHAITSDIFFV